MTDEHSKQVRIVTDVCTSIACGDHSRTISVNAKGDMLIHAQGDRHYNG
jgi:hypothetical protein